MRRLATIMGAASLAVTGCASPPAQDVVPRWTRGPVSKPVPGSEDGWDPGRPPGLTRPGLSGAPATLGTAGDPSDPAAVAGSRHWGGPYPGGQPLPVARNMRLYAEIANYLRKRPGRASVMVDDLGSGTAFGYHPWARYVAASVMKVDILTGLLLRRQERGRSLSPRERRLAARMIRYSDNVAADAVYRKIGHSSGLTRFNGWLGLHATTLDPVAWGSSETSAADQVRLLRSLATPYSPVSEPHRGYVLRLMRGVTDAQRWGNSDADAPGETVAVKNGWTPLRYQGHGWAVNSIGRIRGHGHDFLIAVFSTGSPTQPTGVRTVEHLSQLAVSEFREAEP